MITQIEKLASAIHNNLLGGLSGYHTNYSISLEQIEDSVVNERLLIIKEYFYKGLINPKELYLSINCVSVDCKSVDRCTCKEDCGTPIAHFEIPQLLTEFGPSCISYIGSTDREVPFIVYLSSSAFRNHKYRKRGKNKPYVWIDITPNENGMCDGFIYNAPLLQEISITAAFKDIRQLEEFACCLDIVDNTILDSEIVDRVTKKMLAYYRQYHMPPIPNNQQYTPG